jgi:hypothetical protein
MVEMRPAPFATNDPELERPVYRKSGFEGIPTAKEMDERISNFLKDVRETKNRLV